VDREHIKPGQPVTMTMHRAKGTEFSKVLLFGINEGAIPRKLSDEDYAEDAKADAQLRERSLLYVAATRARDELALSWSGQASPLLAKPAARAKSLPPGPIRCVGLGKPFCPILGDLVLPDSHEHGSIRSQPRPGCSLLGRSKHLCQLAGLGEAEDRSDGVAAQLATI
jgi:hypothetical protein